MGRNEILLAAALLLGFSLSGCIGGGTLEAGFAVSTDDNVTFTFDAGSTAGTGEHFIWNFGDGTVEGGKVVKHTYKHVNGDYLVTLTVLDENGVPSTTSQIVTTGTAPNVPPVLIMVADKRWTAPGDPILFDSRPSNDSDWDPVRRSWNFNYAILDQDIEDMVNLGVGMYEYLEASDAAGNGSAGTQGPAGERGSYEPPSEEELQEAWRRFQEQLPGGTRSPGHGAAEPPYETDKHNETFNGTIRDISPIQYYSWPDPGLYYVRLDLTDIKGATTSGFMAVQVSNDPPALYENETSSVTIGFAGPDIFNSGSVSNFASVPVTMEYPGDFSVFAERVPDSTGSAPTIEMFGCRSQKSFAECKGSPVFHAGPSTGELLAWHFHADPSTPALPGEYTAWIAAESEAPNSANVRVDIVQERFYDTNPWYEFESGCCAGSH